MREAIENFLKTRTLATNRNFHTAIRHFCAWRGFDYDTCDIDSRLEAVRPQDALKYMAEYKLRPGQFDKGISDASFTHRIRVLRSIFQRLVDLELLEKNPFSAVQRLQPQRQRHQVRPTKLTPFHKVKPIITGIDTRTHIGVRDKALMVLLYASGLRRSEALSVCMGDLMLTQKGTLHVELRRTKGGEVQQRAIPKWAWADFSALISQRSLEGAKATDPLFVFYYSDGRPRDSKPMSDSTLYRVFRKCCLKCDVEASPHSARATMVSLAKAKGKDDRTVAAALGHASDQMVKVYDKRARGVDTSAVLDLDYD